VYREVGFASEEFENEYTGIRKKEERLYDDEVARALPAVPDTHPLRQEWKIRGNTSTNFAAYLKVHGCKSVIEIGCGNGWLATLIQKYLNIPVCGVDVGRGELEQAARISKGKSVFVCGDIFSENFDGLKADAIVLASCIQYFPDLKQLIRRLLPMGTIYIIDSPVYKKGESAAARERSVAYFNKMGAPGMEKFYYHHERTALEEFNPKYLSDPSKGIWWFLGLFFKGSPFPWIRIGKST
jgi:SAM-dependent methyltransferase